MGRPRPAKPVGIAGAMACIPLIVAIWLRRSSGAPSAPSRFREQMREFTAFQPARLVPAVVFLGGMGRGARTRPPRRRRPKAGLRQTAQELLGRPGYYWLAQEWDNLFFACPLCNQRYKKNLFPLRDPAARARSHRDDVSREEPLFINPVALGPADFISFREDYPYAIDDNTIGKAAIRGLGLDRERLNEMRRDHPQMLKPLNASANSPLPESGEARNVLNRAIEDSAEYA